MTVGGALSRTGRGTAPPRRLVAGILDELAVISARIEAAATAAQRADALAAAIGLLVCRASVVREAVFEVLATACWRESARASLADALDLADPTVVAAALACLGYLARGDAAAPVGRIAALLGSSDVAVARATAEALRRIGTDGAIGALRRAWVAEPTAYAVLAELCLAGDPRDLDAVVVSIPRRADGGLVWERVPAAIALLVSAEWLAPRLAERIGQDLALRFGYIDAELHRRLASGDPEVASRVGALLRRLGVAVLPMLDAPCSPDSIVQAWADRQLELGRGLLPAEMWGGGWELRPVRTGTDAAGEVEIGLLFAALRAADVASIEVKRLARPFGRKREAQSLGRFFFVTTEQFRTRYVRRWLHEARRLLDTERSSSSELLVALEPYAVMHAAAVSVLAGDEPFAEADLARRSRWRMLGRVLEARDGAIAIRSECRPVLGDLHRPVCRDRASIGDAAALTELVSDLLSPDRAELPALAVLEAEALVRSRAWVVAAESAPAWRELSFGARSASRLLAYAASRSAGDADVCREGWRAKHDALIEDERRVGGVLPAIGIEIQTANVPRELAFAWRRTLERFGVPSPHRPELFHIAEAAIRPARAASALVAAIEALHAMGLFAEYRGGSALHVSLEGAMGPDARLLALAFGTFLRPESPEITIGSAAWYRAITRVMSKGLVHHNPDNQPVGVGRGASALGHTEIRVARLQNDPRDPAALAPAYRVMLPAAQLVGAALMASHARSTGGAQTASDAVLAPLGAAVRDELEAAYRAAGDGGALLVDGDWYEATGDAFDAELVKRLDIVQRLVRARDGFARTPGSWVALQQRVRVAFIAHAHKVADAVGWDGGLPSA